MRCGGGDCGELVVGSVSSRADINYMLQCYMREHVSHAWYGVHQKREFVFNN